MMRFGKRCLAFIGAPDTKTHMLVWCVVGGVVMKIHYKFFKHCTWHSHSKDDRERLTIMDFCPGPGGSVANNPVSTALSELATMLFEPNSAQGKILLQPLYDMFGASIQWSEQLVRMF